MAENEQKPIKLSKAQSSVFDWPGGSLGTTPTYGVDNPWSSDSVDKLGLSQISGPEYKNYRKVVKDCRFFFRRDAMASSVVNKLIEIAFNGIRYSQGTLSDNQYIIFEHLKPEIEDFIESCALEYLISGLVIPEVEFQPITKESLKTLGIKRYGSLTVPQSMWIWDPNVIIIKRPPIGAEESVFVEIDQNILTFISNGGIYAEGGEDKELYNKLVKMYPDFVNRVKNGETIFKLGNTTVIKRRPLVDSPYPTPFLAAALESLRHKRNLRRMDYALASRAIGAIQHIKVGSDDFPVVEGEDDVIKDLKDQMFYRGGATGNEIERIFQLFTNHTVEIDWVIPPLDALVNSTKYEEINLDILQSLGFPKILITGEVQRTGTTDADMAILSPLKTMEFIRRKLIGIVKEIVRQVADQNGFTEAPKVEFNPINLVGFKDFIDGLRLLYESGNLSRTEYSEAFGKDFDSTIRQLVKDNELMQETGASEFAPLPHSNTPENGSNNSENDQNNE